MDIIVSGYAYPMISMETLGFWLKDQYVELVRKIRETLNSRGYYVTVALAPKISADQQGSVYPGHDYPGMGEAADYVLLMTYEWGYTYGPPMAVSPTFSILCIML